MKENLRKQIGSALRCCNRNSTTLSVSPGWNACLVRGIRRGCSDRTRVEAVCQSWNVSLTTHTLSLLFPRVDSNACRRVRQVGSQGDLGWFKLGFLHFSSTPHPCSDANIYRTLPNDPRSTVLSTTHPPSKVPPQGWWTASSAIFPIHPIDTVFRGAVSTDNLGVIQCAVHAGLLTRSSIARAKREGIFALVPTLTSASGAVRSASATTVRAPTLDGLKMGSMVTSCAYPADAWICA